MTQARTSWEAPPLEVVAAAAAELGAETLVAEVHTLAERLAARARLASGDWIAIEPADLASYVAEERNPGNARRVTAVEVFVPSPLLADGMCLVDTLGLGSVFEWNSDSTRAFVPHVDAAEIRR